MKKQIEITKPLAINIKHAVEILEKIEYKYDGHKTELETNDLVFLKNILHLIQTKTEGK